MSIDNLISRAEEVRQSDRKSPKKDLWVKDAKKYLADNYGEGYSKIFTDALFSGRMARGPQQAQQMHADGVARAIEFLVEMKEREPDEEEVKQRTKAILAP